MRRIHVLRFMLLSYYAQYVLVLALLLVFVTLLVVRSNSANAWRANRLFLQKNRTEITSNCSAQCNPFHSQLASENLKSLIPD